MPRSLAILVFVVVTAGACATPDADEPRRWPALVDPEIIVSVRGLTVHLFDRTTGASFVYPARVGGLRADGSSVTPVGHFRTGEDPRNSWWYMASRTEPARYGGMPFLRLTARNPRGEQVYGLHGPVEGGPSGTPYVSRGCVRLGAEDIVALFAMVRDHASIPVTIQEEVAVDAAGQPIVVGMQPVLWRAGEEIPFGPSVGPRPE